MIYFGSFSTAPFVFAIPSNLAAISITIGAQFVAESRILSIVFLRFLELLEFGITFPPFFPVFQILPLLFLSRLSFILFLMISLRPCLLYLG